MYSASRGFRGTGWPQIRPLRPSEAKIVILLILKTDHFFILQGLLRPFEGATSMTSEAIQDSDLKFDILGHLRLFESAATHCEWHHNLSYNLVHL